MTSSNYNQIVDLYADRLFRFVVKNLPNREEARDIVQEAFERLWVKRNQVEEGKEKTYLFTTAYHLVMDFYRKSGRMVYEQKPATDSPASSSEYTGIREVLEEALSRLPEIQRVVITLRDLEGYSYEEIAEIANLNPAQVKVYIYRARLALKNYVGRLENVI